METMRLARFNSIMVFVMMIIPICRITGSMQQCRGGGWTDEAIPQAGENAHLPHRHYGQQPRYPLSVVFANFAGKYCKILFHIYCFFLCCGQRCYHPPCTT